MVDLSKLTDEQLNQLAQSRGIGQAPSQPSADLSSLSDEQLNQLAQSRGILSPTQEVARPILRAAKSVVAGTLGAAGDIAQEAIYLPEALARTGARAIGLDVKPFDYSKVNSVSPMIREGFDKATGGLTKPKNTTEEYVDLGSELLGGAVGPTLAIKGAEAVSKIAQPLTKGISKLGKDIVSGYNSRPVEAINGFTKKPVETLEAVGEAIKEGSSQTYKAMRESGAVLKPETTKTIFQSIDKSLEDSGILNPRLHGDTIGVLADIKELAKAKNGKVGLEELDQYRQLLNDVIKKNTDIAGKLNADGFKANLAINKLDDVVEGLGANGISGDKNSLELLNSARSEWQRYRKFDAITNIVRKADGDPNRIKTLMQNFVNNPKNLRGFSEAEKQAIKDAARNSVGEGLLKAVGKFGFDLGSGRNIGNAALPVGSILIGGGTGSALATVGTLSRQAQKLSAKGKVEDILKLIEGKNPQIVSAVIQKLPFKTRNIVLTNILTNISSRGMDGIDAQAAEPTKDDLKEMIRNDFKQRYPSREINEKQIDKIASGLLSRSERQKKRNAYRQEQIKDQQKSGQQLRERDFYN